MNKGAAFESKTLTYLGNLFTRLGFDVTEKRRQSAGTQNGFDVKIGFLDQTGRERKLYFECKNYSSPLSWNDIVTKIFALHTSGHRPDGFIAISPHVDLSNGNSNIIDKLQLTLQAPIRCWSPNTCIREFFSLDSAFYEEVYGEKPGPEYQDSAAILEKLKGIVKDLLQQKDELIGQPSFPKELTLLMPRIDPGSVIGRDQELQEVHELLFGRNHPVVVVNGMGGIGKTTLAQAYVTQYFHEYAHVAWITQLTGDIVGDMTSAAGLSENLRMAEKDADAETLFYEILRRMKSIPDAPNLLILDNVGEDLAEWKDYLPGKPHWHLLATSRQHIEGFYPKELDFLSRENAIALFKKHCSLIQDETMIAELVGEVDNHTLTIEILAKTGQLQRKSIETLRLAIKEDVRANVYIQHKGDKIDKVFSYLSSIFNCMGLDEMQQWLMKQFVCLPTQFHSYTLLLQLIDPDEKKRAEFAETCNRLAEQGWLLFDAAADAYKMHVIVQEVAKRQLTPVLNDVEPLVETVNATLVVDEDEDNPAEKFIWIPFGYALLQALASDLSPDIGQVLYQLGRLLRFRGDYAGAKELLEKAVAIDEYHYGPDDPITADSYTNLAMVLRYMGDYDEARLLFEKAVASGERAFGPDDHSTIMNYANLAMVLQDQGDYVGALKLFKRAAESEERTLGPDHPATAVSYSNVAIMLKNLGDFAGARVLLEKVVASDERNFGPDHPRTAEHYSNLGTVLKDLGDYPGAKRLLEKAIASSEHNFGPDHPSTAVHYSNLANVLKLLGDYAGARILLEKTILSGERDLGPEHPLIGVRYMNLALVLHELGDNEKALAVLAHSLVIFNKTLPEGHPYRSAARQNYDLIKERSGG